MKRLLMATALMTSTQPAPPPAAQGMMGAMPMMNTMSGMPMMHMGMMMGPGSGMSTIDHIEGRIAFLRAELKITDAQMSAWNAFADALRANARKLGEVPAAMMSGSGARQQQALTQDCSSASDQSRTSP